ncbi:hypothetical protein [Chryseobacterium indologenes]|uniref:Uncharacterized protein n=1 Tax=Chryseobacterium indologenes TaxID=253 RepID=A0A0N0IUL7_CHRID|nr:hypothetical protein [Chryseobacterium indologenes]KPE49751.1 hypothetical protein AOB46_18670 [Chryseobacterium indologenes]
MATYTKLKKTISLKSAKTGEVVDIFKYKKDGTKRIFFATENNGIRLNDRMHSTLWLAKAEAGKFLDRNK